MMPSVTQATGWYFRFTWDIAPCVDLHVCPHGPSAGIPWLMVQVSPGRRENPLNEDESEVVVFSVGRWWHSGSTS